jgi:hypothetical protein
VVDQATNPAPAFAGAGFIVCCCGEQMKLASAGVRLPAPAEDASAARERPCKQVPQGARLPPGEALDVAGDDVEAALYELLLPV